MNETIAQFARHEITKELSKCTHSEQTVFRKMYSPNNLHKPIEDVVNELPSEKLSWALTQIQNTRKNDHSKGVSLRY